MSLPYEREVIARLGAPRGAPGRRPPAIRVELRASARRQYRKPGGDLFTFRCDRRGGIPLEPFRVRQRLLSTLAFCASSFVLFAVSIRGFPVSAVFRMRMCWAHFQLSANGLITATRLTATNMTPRLRSV